jgi:LacI family gluconate utilization system Gnt-I transcriptional repressor
MDACRQEIGQKAAQIIAARWEENADQSPVSHVLTPKLSHGDTLKRNK